MIYELDICCRRKGHGNLILEENCGMYYTYCPACLVSGVPANRKSPYEYCSLTIKGSIEQYLEMEEYLKRHPNAKRAYKEEWKRAKYNVKTVAGVEIKIIEPSVPLSSPAQNKEEDDA